MSSPVNYLGRMIRDAILMLVGVIAMLIFGEQLIKQGSHAFGWAGFALGLFFMAAGLIFRRRKVHKIGGLLLTSLLNFRALRRH
jgi:LPXTG-motif cell wall-anchored protein